MLTYTVESLCFTPNNTVLTSCGVDLKPLVKMEEFNMLTPEQQVYICTCIHIHACVCVFVFVCVRTHIIHSYMDEEGERDESEVGREESRTVYSR